MTSQRRILPSFLTAAAAVAAISGCGSGATVQRRHGAELEAGRRIPAAGYAYYAQAVALERQGQLELARTAYERARNADESSGSAWAGLARSFCKSDPARALTLFEDGLARAEELYPLYLARANCRLSWKQPAQSLDDARSAMNRSPDRAEASEAVARAAAASGDEETASATRRAYALYQGSPTLPPARRDALDGQARLEAADSALQNGKLPLAQSLAAGLLRPGELALRALALGQNEQAMSQTELVLAAAANDPDASVARAILTPRSAEGQPEPYGLSALGACLYASHLGIWIGAASAQLFLDRVADGPPPPIELWQRSGDTLLQECSRHLLTLL